jgi:hypothetical protein
MILPTDHGGIHDTSFYLQLKNGPNKLERHIIRWAGKTSKGQTL